MVGYCLNGGGLGLVDGGRGDRSWLERELAIVIGSTDCPQRSRIPELGP